MSLGHQVMYNLSFIAFPETFLHINDQINTVLDRYEAFKRGDYTAAANPIPKELAGSAAQGLSLIDFDDSAPPAGSGAEAAGGASTIDELASLFGPGASSTPQQPQQPNRQQQIQQIQQLQQQQYQQPAYSAPQQHANPNANLFAQLGMGGSGPSTPSVYSPQPSAMAGNATYGAQGRPPFASSASQGAMGARTGSAMSGTGTPPPGQGALRLGSPNPYMGGTASPAAGGLAGIGMGGVASGHPGSGLGMGIGGSVGMGVGGSVGMGVGLQPQHAPAQQQQQQPQAQQPAQGQGKDPFADLVGLF